MVPEVKKPSKQTKADLENFCADYGVAYHDPWNFRQKKDLTSKYLCFNSAASIVDCKAAILQLIARPWDFSIAYKSKHGVVYKLWAPMKRG